MQPAAVGYQCPECVQAGMARTRQQAGPYGGRRSTQPQLTSIILIAINVVVFGATWLTGGTFGRLFNLLALKPGGFCMAGDKIYLSNATECAAIGYQWVDGVATGAWWQPLSSAFMHDGIMHIAFNMVALFVLGPGLEQIIGRARFLAVYFVSALMGSAFVMWLSAPYTSVVGASGAIFGLMGAVLLLSVKHRGNVRSILMWLGLNVVITVANAGSISWQGHLGGFLGGLAATAAIIYLPKQLRGTWQWPLVVLAGVVAIAATAARALTLT